MKEKSKNKEIISIVVLDSDGEVKTSLAVDRKDFMGRISLAVYNLNLWDSCKSNGSWTAAPALVKRECRRRAKVIADFLFRNTPEEVVRMIKEAENGK